VADEPDPPLLRYTIYQSERGPIIRIWFVCPGRRWYFEQSTTLTNWTRATGHGSAAGAGPNGEEICFTETGLGTGGPRFFRVVMP